jgi:hypothetical protein
MQLPEQLERQPVQLYLRIQVVMMMVQTVINDGLTLAAAPTKADSAASNRKALHLFNGTFSICFAHKLHKAAVLPDGHFHLQCIGKILTQGSPCVRQEQTHIVNITERSKECSQCLLGDQW